VTAFLPAHPEEITPAWLSAALQQRPEFADLEVCSIDVEILGADAGFMGVIARMRLATEPSGLPQSLIAKFPTTESDNRLMGEMLGVYWREIHFYREFAADFPVRVPRCYYAELTPDPMRERSDDIVKAIDRIPFWLNALLTPISRWIVKRNAHRYVLLIEDLAPARVGDQLAGAEPAVLAHVLEAAARMHARFWQSPRLEEPFWLTRQNLGARMRHGLYRRSRKAFRARYDRLLRDERAAAVAWLDRNGIALQTALGAEAPRTLIHGDLRFDNVFLYEEQAIFADWQLVGSGAAAYDLAYFLSGALRSDAGSEVEQSLLHGYHDSLTRHGVREYPFERLQQDYWRGLFAAFSVIASSDALNFGDGRGRQMMDRWVERCLSLLARVPLERVL
jgi:hypothetical protein